MPLLPAQLNLKGCHRKSEVLSLAQTQLPEGAIAYFVGKDLRVLLPAQFPVLSEIKDVSSTRFLLEKKYYQTEV